MAKAQRIAEILVERDWWRGSVAKLLLPQATLGTSDLHRVRGPVVRADSQGLWLGEAPSTLVRAKDKSRAPVPMEILIPWSRMVAVGIIDEPSGVTPGFGVSDVAVTLPAGAAQLTGHAPTV